MTDPGARRQVFLLGGGQADAPGMTPEVVGAKAYGLARMERLGLPVPPAFVLSTGFCTEYLERGYRQPDDLTAALTAHVRWLENATGRSIGGTRRPLLVSVRSSPPVSMPGMLATILNVGLNNRTVRGLFRLTGNPQLAWDLYRRLVQSFAESVRGCPREPFDAALAARLAELDVPSVQELDAESLKALSRENLDLVLETTDEPFPQDPMEQLTAAVEAVFRSWESPRAREYRRVAGLDGRAGTGVVIQAMVFGNAGGASGAGVGFTRNPATGANEMYLDFLFNAQGEDVVSGRYPVAGRLRLRDVLPAVDAELARVRSALEAEFRDLQDFEFTVEDGRLYVLQTRAGKRTPLAALRAAVEMVREGLIDPATALARLRDVALDKLERTYFANGVSVEPLASAVPAGIGVATGAVVFDVDAARARAASGLPVILVREEMSTDDIGGIAIADGVLTAVGGRTSHAAVVARHLGKPCLVGCSALHVDLDARRGRLGRHDFVEGDWMSIDAEGGRVYAGRLPIARERPEEALRQVRQWQTAPLAGVAS